MAPPASAGRCGPTEETTVRFAYTLIQPWSLGLVCKCDAIFRPVSRVYNTFGLENPLRGPGPRRCAPRACYVRVCTARWCATASPIRTRAYVRCNCRTRQTGYPSAPQHQHQPPGHRLQHQTGSLHAFGREHHPPAVCVRPSALSPTSILTSAFLFSSTPRPFLFLFLFLFLSLSLFLSISLSISRSLLLPLLPRCAKHRDMHEHQTALTAEVTHPSTRRCLPMDS